MSEQDEAKFRENLSKNRAKRLRNDSELSHFEETADQHLATSWSASEHLETINKTYPTVSIRTQVTFHSELGARIKIKQSKSREKSTKRPNEHIFTYQERLKISDNSRYNRRNYNTFSKSSNSRNSERQHSIRREFHQTTEFEISGKQIEISGN